MPFRVFMLPRLMTCRIQIALAVLLLSGGSGGVAISQEGRSPASAGLDVETLAEFNRLDRNGDGGLNRVEFEFTEIGQRFRFRDNQAKLDRIFLKIDRDDDGKIGLFELAQSQHNRNVRIMDRETSGKFAEFDGDDDGFISRLEFAASPSAKKAIESGKDESYVAQIFAGLDLNESGVIGPFEYSLLKDGAEVAETRKEGARRFARVDRNDDGVIDREEFLETPLARHSTSSGESPGEFDEIFGAIDVNGNGEISAQEFSRARENRDKAGIPEVIINDYEDLDRNEDGLISLREFGRAEIAKRAPNRTAMAAMFARADLNRDQGIGLREFFELRKRIRARAMDRLPGKGGGGGGKVVPRVRGGGGGGR